MSVDNENLQRCIQLLEEAHQALLMTPPDSPLHHILQSNVVKQFEVSQEVLFKLLRHILKDFGYGSETIYDTPAKGLLRRASEHELLDIAALQRWMVYRDARNATAHNYGFLYVETVLEFLPEFKEDIVILSQTLQAYLDKDLNHGG